MAVSPEAQPAQVAQLAQLLRLCSPGSSLAQRSFKERTFRVGLISSRRRTPQIIYDHGVELAMICPWVGATA